MLPVMTLAVGAGHRCLDMCASPGSKTTQILTELAKSNFQRFGRGLETISSEEILQCDSFFSGRIDYSKDEGFVIANDLDPDRTRMLVHQLERHEPLFPLTLFTSHDAQYFPSIWTPDGDEVRFDRILCDVPCSGDGTLRKNPRLWNQWNFHLTLGHHATQLGIALRAARLLKVGGRMVYSTCTMSPMENEAVVARLLQCTHGSLVLVDARETIAPFRTCHGLREWYVAHPRTHKLYTTYMEAISTDGESNKLLPQHFPPPLDSDVSSALPNCMRILSHLNNTGGFFIAVFEKVAELSVPSPVGAVGSDRDADNQRAYDSDIDDDREQVLRERTAINLKDAIANARNEIEKAKAVAKQKRAVIYLTQGSIQHVPLAESMPDVHEAIQRVYGLSSQLMELFYCRYDTVYREGENVGPYCKRVYLFSRGIANLVFWGTQKHTKRKLRVVTAGSRAFQRDCYIGGAEAYRFGQETLDLLLPYVRQRIVALDDVKDSERLLCHGKDAPLKDLVSPQRVQLEEMHQGGLVLLLRTSKGLRFALSGFRTKNAVLVYVSDDDLPAVQRLFGLEPKIPIEKTSEAVNLPQ